MTDPESTSACSTPGESSEARREVRFQYSRQFLPIMRHLRSSLFVSTYSAGKLAVVGASDDGLLLRFHNFEQAMGVACGPRRLAVGARGQVWFLHNGDDLAQRMHPSGTHDLCYVTRKSLVTGNIHVHELAWADDELWVVNTLFSCLCTLHDEFSFVPRWQPPFITELAAQDRCHLNGLAMRDGRPAYVTAMAESDEPAGWRETKATSGVIVDVQSGHTIAHGFSMPHSPRIYQERLWVLNSGTGTLETVDMHNGQREVVVEVPGYTRGLAFHGQFAFVGLSKIRETSVFGGVPIAEKRDELKCGVVVVDLHSRQSVAYLEFQSGVDEIFDVQVVPGIQSPALVGPFPEQDDMTPLWVIPKPDDVKGIVD